MSFNCFSELRFKLLEIYERVKDIVAKRNVDTKIHTDEEVFSAVKTGLECVDMRRFNVCPVREPRDIPTWAEIPLRLTEWQALKARVAKMVAIKSRLGHVKLCSDLYAQKNPRF